MTVINEAVDVRYVALRRYAIGVLAGGVVGLAIGGGAGRLAMYLLRLTSPASSIGKTTDAKTTIGEWSLHTFELFEVGIALGVLVGMLYVPVRPWLPARGRPLMTGIFGAFAGGAMFTRPHGVDFYLTRPLWLSVALFALLPGVFGYLLSLTVERLVERGFWDAAPVWLLWMPIVVATPMVVQISGPVTGAVVVLAGILTAVLSRRFRTGLEVWRAPATRWIGSRLLIVLTAVNIGVVVHAIMLIHGHPGGMR